MVLNAILNALQNLTLTEEEFQDEYLKYVDSVKAAVFSDPYKLIYTTTLSLIHPAFSVNERMHCLNERTFTLQDVKDHAVGLIVIYEVMNQ